MLSSLVEIYRISAPPFTRTVRVHFVERDYSNREMLPILEYISRFGIHNLTISDFRQMLKKKRGGKGLETVITIVSHQSIASASTCCRTPSDQTSWNECRQKKAVSRDRLLTIHPP